MNNRILNHFKKVDPKLYEIAREMDLTDLIKPKDFFVDLVDSITSQQLSGKAAATIFGRLKDLYPNGKITPELTIKIDTEKMRGAGLSYSKIKYIKGIAKAIIDREIDLNKLDEVSDDEVINELIKLKGVGTWTAEMFLMFTLLRQDIFSAGDLGLQNAMIKLYKLEDKPTREELLEISKNWSPYRTTASRVLWKSLEK